jgi:hypothetical protein
MLRLSYSEAMTNLQRHAALLGVVAALTAFVVLPSFAASIAWAYGLMQPRPPAA